MKKGDLLLRKTELRTDIPKNTLGRIRKVDGRNGTFGDLKLYLEYNEKYGYEFSTSSRMLKLKDL